jgi:hypothetical protein
MCFQYTYTYGCECVETAPLFPCADKVTKGLCTMGEVLPRKQNFKHRCGKCRVAKPCGLKPGLILASINEHGEAIRKLMV